MATLLDMTPDELAELLEYVEVMLGGEDVDVDITEREVKVAACRALKVYMKEINQWQVRSQFADVYGSSAAINFTKRFVLDNTMISQRLSDWFASMARVGGKTAWKKDYITLQDGRQIYNLATESSTPYVPGSRRIHRILWNQPPELVGKDFVPDILFSNLWSFGQSGLTFGGHRLAYLGQLEDIVLLTQAFETRNKILFSEFFYNIGGDILEITPMPGNALKTPPNSKLFYYYFDESEFANFEGQDPSDPAQTLIVNPLQMQLENLPYSEFNSVAKTWIDGYTLALAKYMQAAKWRKVRSIASPTSEYQIEFDYSGLLDEAKTEQEELLQSLRDELEWLDPVKLRNDKAEMAEASAKVAKYHPRKLFIG